MCIVIASYTPRHPLPYDRYDSGLSGITMAFADEEVVSNKVRGPLICCPRGVSDVRTLMQFL